MNCLSCANLDLQTYKEHARTGLGACLAAKFSGRFRSFIRERSCSMFAPAANDVVEARVAWANKSNLSTKEGEK